MKVVLIFVPLALPLTLPLALSFCFFSSLRACPPPPKHEKIEKDKANGNVNGNANGTKISTTENLARRRAMSRKKVRRRQVPIKKSLALFREGITRSEVHTESKKNIIDTFRSWCLYHPWTHLMPIHIETANFENFKNGDFCPCWTN